MNKLKIKIKKLKNSKKYYKNLYEKIINLKETDKNSLNKNSDSAVISKLENNNFIYEKGKQSINNNEIKNSEINKNINHLNKSKTINEESSVESESSNEKNSPRKFNLDKFKINSEINLFIKSKYINLEKFTDGEFSKNDDLQKQSLNFIKVFLEVEKKTKKKKLNVKNLKEKRKSFYSLNNDLRNIMNKFSLNCQRNSFSIKNENLINNNKYLFKNNDENNINNFYSKFKNNYFQKRKSIKKINNNKIKNYYNFPLNSSKRGSKKIDSSINNRKGSFSLLKFPEKLKKNNEYEKEISIIKSGNCISVLNSMNIEDNKKDSIIKAK